MRATVSEQLTEPLYILGHRSETTSIETLWMRCGPILSHLYDTGNFSWAVHPHDVVLEGLEKQDGAMVREAIRRDIIEGGQSLIDYLSAQENPPMARRASR